MCIRDSLNVTGITTFSDRINVVSGVSTFQDNAKLTFGTQGDLEIYHNGSASYIQDNGTGDLIIRASDQLKIQDSDNGESMAVFNKDAAVDLYYDNTKTFNTTPQGINVSGVTTSNRLDISGISTIGGDLDINSNIDDS